MKLPNACPSCGNAMEEHHPETKDTLEWGKYACDAEIALDGKFLEICEPCRASQWKLESKVSQMNATNG